MTLSLSRGNLRPVGSANALAELSRMHRAAVPASFTALAIRCGVELTNAQREFARVAFDGGTPAGQVGKQLFGELSKIPDVARRTVVGVCGRGSGKTRLAGLRVVHLSLTISLERLGPGEVAFCPVIAPDLKTAQQTVSFARGAAEQLGCKLEDNGVEGFTLVRSDGHRVRVEARAASAGGRSIRGRSMPCAVLDECAFFRDATYKVNDADIYDALRPRIMPGGQILVLSTPWAELGLLYDLYSRNWGQANDALVAHAPTSLMRTDDPELLALIEAERRIDAVKAAREYDADFQSAHANAFFDARAIASAITSETIERKPDATVAIGCDFAFRRDSSAFVAVQFRGGTLDVLEVLELAPSPAEPLAPSRVVATFAEAAQRIGCDELIADGHYRESVSEHLHEHGMKLAIAPEGSKGKADTYQVVRALMHEGKIRIPKHERLARQLREITARASSGGGVVIESPRWVSGGHGDLVSAFVLAVWRAWRLGWVEPEKPKVVIDEIERALMDDLAREQQWERRARKVMGF